MAEYICSVCKVEFDEEEKEITQDEHKCILHCSKTDKNNWYVRNENNLKIWDVNKIVLFWNALNIMIHKTIKDASIEQEQNEIIRINENGIYSYELSKIYFPPNSDENKIFFQEKYFENHVLGKKILHILFLECYFLETVEFHYFFNAKDVIFRHCKFYEKTLFFDFDFNNIFILEFCIAHKYMSFVGIIFRKVASFEQTKFMHDLDFINTKFGGIVSFYNCLISNIKLENTSFRDELNFLKVLNIKEKALNSKNIFDRETARKIKDSFEKQNNIIEANKYYALEMKKREKEIQLLKQPLDWLVFKFHMFSSNHSQNWILPIGWILLISYFISYIKTEYGVFESILYNFFIYNILDKMANVINPFSIMTKGESLTFGMLLFKVMIAYLIYQFIVSVRQNTRRK